MRDIVQPPDSKIVHQTWKHGYLYTACGIRIGNWKVHAIHKGRTSEPEDTTRCTKCFPKKED